MTKKELTGTFVMKKKLFILLAVLFLVLAFSCKADRIQIEEIEQQTLFSNDSQSKIRRLLMNNLRYPNEAKNSGISDKFYVIVMMDKGGRIKTAYTNDKNKSLNIPVICTTNVMFIINKSSATTGENRPSELVTNKLTILEDEGIRVAKMLESLKLPEWQDKSMEFAILFNFNLTNK